MPAFPRPGDRLAGFRIERELGHGTTGVVFLARQERLDRRVALKVAGRPLADDAAFRERFRREARAVAGLDHPNVVQILESGEDDAHLWLAMRLVDGPDLRVLLRRTGRLEPEQAVVVVEQVASALDAAHAAGLVHRDVKPSNVLIEDGPGRDLHVELADFGLARVPGIHDPDGTPGYAAPEQLEGAEAGPAADVFGLGCVLHELLTGVAPPPPAPADRPGVARRAPAGPVDGRHPPLRPSLALPALGGAFDPAVERATDPDPAARFASAGDLALWARAALTVPRAVPAAADPVRISASTPATAAEVGPAAPTWESPPPPRRRRGRRLLLAAFLALVLAALVTAFVFFDRLDPADRDGATAGGVPTPAGGSATGTTGRGAAGTGGSGTPGSATGGPGTASGATASGRAGGAGATGGGTGATAGGASGGTGTSGSGTGGAGAPSGAGAGTALRSRPADGSAGATSASGGAGGAGTPAGGPGAPGSAGRAGGAVPRAGADAPAGSTTAALPPVPRGFVRFGGGGWALDLPAAEGWRQTAVQERDGGARILTRLARPDAVRIVVEALPGRTAVVGVPGARTFPVRLPAAGRTDGALYRGGRFAMCASGVCAALAANGPNGGVLLVAGAHRPAGAERVARRAASSLRVR